MDLEEGELLEDEDGELVTLAAEEQRRDCVEAPTHESDDEFESLLLEHLSYQRDDKKTVADGSSTHRRSAKKRRRKQQPHTGNSSAAHKKVAGQGKSAEKKLQNEVPFRAWLQEFYQKHAPEKVRPDFLS